MIEFMLGLVGITVVVAMLAQINFISAGDPEHGIIGHTRMVIDTRNKVADLLAGNSSGKYEADYLAGWEDGPDGDVNTADDTPIKGDAGSFLNDMGPAMSRDIITETVQAQGFQNDAFSTFSGGSSGQMGKSFHIYRVEGQTTLTNSLAVQRLVSGADELVFEHKIYMPQVDGLWESSGL